MSRNIKDHLGAFIEAELCEGVEKLNNDGIIYESEYQFAWSHIIEYHFDYINEKLQECGLEDKIYHASKECGNKGFMHAIYNTNIFSYEEAQELIYKKYYL